MVNAADREKRSLSVPLSPEEIEAQLADVSVVRLLGSGGMGAVYLARQLHLNRLVAIKILTPQRAEDPVFEERFLREARALASLNHPHIVSLYDVGRMGETWFIMMEYVDGANLRELISEGRLSSTEALRLVPQVCDAIQYAHDHGVVHRDIKPENILIDQNGQVKIADFGLVKCMVEVFPDNFTLTDSGLRMGTAGYMAPEQSSGTQGVDHRADIYSLGVIFYELLTGKRPTPDYTPPSQISEVDARVDRVIARSLKESPDERFQHASLMKDAIERISPRWPWLPLAFVATASSLFVLIATWNALQKPETRTRPKMTLDRNVPSAIALVEPFNDQAASSQQEAWARKLNLPVVETNSLNLEFRLIPPGQLTLGIDSVARITKPFYMSATEVTVGAFGEFVDAMHYRTVGETSGDGGWIHSKNNAQGLERNPEYTWDNELFAFDNSLPVAMVTIRDIDAFIAWLNQREGRKYRLPTFTEWNWASHAGAPSRLRSNDPVVMSQLGWHSGNSDHHAQLVAKKLSNPWGLYDVFGNVCEYVQDETPRQFPIGVFDDPLYPPSAQRRTGCGGSFADPMHSILHYLNGNLPFHSVGFRLVLEIPADEESAK
jgi:serine/threonine protein kinase